MADSPVRLDDLITHVRHAAPAEDPLGRVGVAVRTAADIDQVGDHLIGHFVDEARAAGLSWTAIGEHLGVTKQAARKRFIPRETPLVTQRAGIFERFSGEARHVIVTAQEAARRMRHDHIGTEHILLGICAEQGCAALAVLAACGTTGGAVQDAVRAAVAPGTARPQGHIPFAPTAKESLDLAVRAALRLRHDGVGTEHLLLGVLTVGSGTAAEILRDLGVTAQTAEAALPVD